MNSDTATNLPISWQGRSALRVCVSMTYVVPLTLLHRSERILCGSAQDAGTLGFEPRDPQWRSASAASHTDKSCVLGEQPRALGASWADPPN